MTSKLIVYKSGTDNTCIVTELCNFELSLRRNSCFGVCLTEYFFFKRLHLTPRLYTYHRHAGTYDFKSELRAFFTTDGKALLIIYGACALLCEISHLLPIEIINQFSLVCIPFFTPYILLSDIPVLRSLLSFLFAVALMSLLVARHGKRQFTKELHPQGPEQPTAPIVVQPRWRK